MTVRLREKIAGDGTNKWGPKIAFSGWFNGRTFRLLTETRLLKILDPQNKIRNQEFRETGARRKTGAMLETLLPALALAEIHTIILNTISFLEEFTEIAIIILQRDTLVSRLIHTIRQNSKWYL